MGFKSTSADEKLISVEKVKEPEKYDTNSFSILLIYLRYVLLNAIS